MSYGVEVYNQNGRKTFDSERLKHRLWWQGEIYSTGNYYYDTPIKQEPTIVCYASNGGFPYVWEHITSNGEYIGFKVISNDRTNDPSIFFVFARR